MWCLAELVEARELHLPQAHGRSPGNLCVGQGWELEIAEAMCQLQKRNHNKEHVHLMSTRSLSSLQRFVQFVQLTRALPFFSSSVAACVRG